MALEASLNVRKFLVVINDDGCGRGNYRRNFGTCHQICGYISAVQFGAAWYRTKISSYTPFHIRPLRTLEPFGKHFPSISSSFISGWWYFIPFALLQCCIAPSGHHSSQAKHISQ